MVRIDRTTLATTSYAPYPTTLSAVHNSLATHDTDGDGSADFLYYRGFDEEIYFLCDMDATGYTDLLRSWGTGAGYGLGFTGGATPTVWAYDDLSPGDLLRIR